MTALILSLMLYRDPTPYAVPVIRGAALIAIETYTRAGIITGLPRMGFRARIKGEDV